MQSSGRLLSRQIPHTHVASTRLLSISTRSNKEHNEPDWSGRKAEEHVTNRGDELDIHASASKSGKGARASDSGNSSATSEKDNKSDNQRAKQDHPEAPGPVLGMNDERGGVCSSPSYMVSEYANGRLEGTLGNRQEVVTPSANDTQTWFH
ncbi:hypothetical protein MMC06_001470 [Schaereria dolodes]|nr:hypothetical protein [Schaereria dolodes]